MASLFTKIINGEIPSYTIAEDDNYFAFLDIRPMSKGHTLVIPKREEDYIFDLEDEELAGILPFAKKVAGAIEKAVDCKRIGISVVGLEVPHAHVHLIPINSISDMTFMKDPVEMSEEEFKDLAEEIRSHL
jgi:histidine triad (HIT) family protein